MFDYFRGWKRKTGLLALVLSSVFAAGWVRSRLIMDHFCYRTSASTYQELFSVAGQIWWTGTIESRGKLDCKWYSSNQNTNILICRPEDILWRRKFFEFEFGEFPDPNIGNATYCIAPYWSIVIPLTLLSAYLLLSKPRVSKTRQP
jgi:hypothetical protein